MFIFVYKVEQALYLFVISEFKLLFRVTTVDPKDDKFVVEVFA